MNKYEIAVVYHPDLEVDLDKAEKRVLKIFSESEAKLINTDNWGKRKLAYPIKKLHHGVYVIYTLNIAASSVQKIENLLNITDEIIRYLIVKIDEKIESKIASQLKENTSKLEKSETDKKVSKPKKTNTKKVDNEK